MDEKHVVTCFLEHNGEIALFKRSRQVGTYRGRWAGVSGYIEEGNTPLDQALEELREETGLHKEDILLLKQGSPLEVIDRQMGRKWVVHPFRFRITGSMNIVTDWENTEIRWIDPADIEKYETVPDLKETWEKVNDNRIG